MVFSSLEFIFQFLPIFLLIYFLCPARYKNFCLFAGSMLFYLYGVWDTPLYLALFGASMAVNYFFGCRIAPQPGQVPQEEAAVLGSGL